MDDLFLAAQAYCALADKDYCYTLSDGTVIRVQFRRRNFKHLAGLDKLKDLYFVSSGYSSTSIFKMILRKRITLYDLQASCFFDTEANERVRELCRLDELLRTGQMIYPFSSATCRARTSLKSSVLFFKETGFNFYLTLGAALDNEGAYYPETFFWHFDDLYIRGQRIVKVARLDVTSI